VGEVGLWVGGYPVRRGKDTLYSRWASGKMGLGLHGVATQNYFEIGKAVHGLLRAR